MSEEVMLINDIPYYRIPNGTSYTYAPIPKEFKPYFERLQQENKQLKEELQKADSITQSCIFEGKEESTINFRECLNKLELYKEVIEEVRELLKGCIEKYGIHNMNTKDFDDVLQILDKAKEK